MPNRHITTLAVAIAGFALAAPLAAQGRSVASSAMLDIAVTARPVNNREVLRTLLATPAARRVAARMGQNPSELSARVSTLDQASVNLLAERARTVQPDLAGGSGTIVISTTAVIIGLLIIILLIA